MSEELRAALGKIASGCTVNSTDAANETVKWMQGIASAALRASTDAAAVGDWIGPVPCDGSKPDWLPDDALCMIAYNPRESQNAMTWEFAEKRAKPVRDRDWDGVTAFCFKLVAHPPADAAAVAGEGKWPATCDGIEQDAFEAWAKGERFVMDTHPIHWLFLNSETNAARKGWKAGLVHAAERCAALSHPAPTTRADPAQAIAIGRKLDAEDGGYPAPAEPVGLREDQRRRRETLIERIGTFADGLSAKPLPGVQGDVAYDLLRQAAAQISSDNLALSTLTRTDEASAEGEGRS